MTAEKYEALLEAQKQRCRALEEQLTAMEKLAEERNGQTRLLKEQIRILQEKQAQLVEAGNRLAAENKRLEGICTRQQKLLEELSAMVREITAGASNDEQP